MQTDLNGFVFVCSGPNQPPAKPLQESLPLLRMTTMTRRQVGRFVKRPERAGDEMEPALHKTFSLSVPPQLCPERKGRRQEKMVARQARRDGLKRLHRAQVLRRRSISHWCTLKCCSGPRRPTVAAPACFRCCGNLTCQVTDRPVIVE